ncbi:MAG: AAA family ATPase [Oceanospirillaceae bacterium]|nr:AAA family ATPase [Oceanospirillaceae bacterium]
MMNTQSVKLANNNTPPSLTPLRQLMTETHTSCGELARAVNLSRTAIYEISHNKWPKRISRSQVEESIKDFLKRRDCTALQLHHLFTSDADNTKAIEEYPMLAKQRLTQAAKKHFKLFSTPFGEINTVEDIFISPDVEMARMALYMAAKNGGFVGLIGECGSGKSTLRRDLINRLERDNEQMVIIEPYICGMSTGNKQGTLTTNHITTSLFQSILPQTKRPQGAQDQGQMIHKALIDSHKVGIRHCLIIEEAHDIPLSTLKQLKRLHELEFGFTKVLSIILIGQPELKQRLDVRNLAVREVAQRMELMWLDPLDQHLQAYVEHRIKRVGKQASDIFATDAYESIRRRLSVVDGRQRVHSLINPLAVNNLAIAGMNLSADLGEDLVTADIINQIRN